MSKKEKKVTVIKRSSTTGKIVWFYRGPSKGAARQAYRRAKRSENTRIRWWLSKMKRRARHLKDYLDRLIASLPMMGDITPEKRQALRDLQRMADTPPKPDTDFYNHLQRERRHRKKKRDERKRREEQG